MILLLSQFIHHFLVFPSVLICHDIAHEPLVFMVILDFHLTLPFFHVTTDNLEPLWFFQVHADSHFLVTHSQFNRFSFHGSLLLVRSQFDVIDFFHVLQFLGNLHRMSIFDYERIRFRIKLDIFLLSDTILPDFLSDGLSVLDFLELVLTEPDTATVYLLPYLIGHQVHLSVIPTSQLQLHGDFKHLVVLGFVPCHDKRRNTATYQRDRNYFSDSTFYYLCVDSGVGGLRVGEKATLPVEGTTTVITDFPDFVWHEAELMSPYFQGQNWFGECISQPDSLLCIPFVMPNVVTNKPAYMKSQVMGRIKNVAMYYDAWVNDNHVANHVPIGKYGDNYFGTLASLNKQIALENDTIEFKLGFSADRTASLYLDYVEIYAWRTLKRVGEAFPFRLMPSQFGDGVSAIWVQNTDAQHWLWEVTDPLRPVRQNGVLSANNLVFATDENTEKRYLLFNPDAALEVSNWTAIANQNVHSIADADMLILAPAIFRSQALALADYHAELDGMLSVVVDVDEILNEFGTGIPDPSAIRDFVRMVYRRSGGRLKYLTLFGRASADYRNIKGYGRNYVLTYEAKDNPQHEVAFCTDDYFGMMDDDEGPKSDGHIDIGIGRLPVSTVEEAETVVRKIMHYNDLASTHGDWKTGLLLVSDDENTEYVNNNEKYGTMFDTINHALTQKKIYVGAYPTANTSGGVTVPGANADLMQALDKGTLLMIYVGHGGVRGLTGEYVFTNSDIHALVNYDRMPFVYTATCEFSKYDNPLLVSAGEQMFLNPDGGSVAMFTTCRPTFGNNNNKHSQAFVKTVCQRGTDGKPLRFGDIVRLTKNDPLNYFNNAPQANINIRFVLLGDPALRFPEPMQRIEVQKINGAVVSESGPIELHAMSLVNVEGEIKGLDGTVDAGFNGKLWVRFFDKKTKVRVNRYSDGFKNVYYHKNVLYHGCATVSNGKFTISFQVPKEILPERDRARFSFYAYDSIRGVDAMGCFDELTLDGTDPAAIADDEGPKIDFYWNSPEFENGQSVERFGTLFADLYDAQGIYHYDYSLGRDIILSSNQPAFDRLVLNDRYEPALNDFRRGPRCGTRRTTPPRPRSGLWSTTTSSSRKCATSPTPSPTKPESP